MNIWEGGHEDVMVKVKRGKIIYKEILTIGKMLYCKYIVNVWAIYVFQFVTVLVLTIRTT